MLYLDEPVFLRPLANGLVLRTVANERELERVAEFNGVMHGSGIVSMTRNLFLHHPDTSGRDLIFVEEEQTGRVVSSLCLIPWMFRYEDTIIRAGEMGIVGTAPDYRRLGLVREQVVFFKQRLKERGCLLSHIQGIPYYYRQFGYEYALPLEGGLRLTLRESPKPAEQSFAFRLATSDDIPTLMRLYEQAAEDLTIHVQRSAEIWNYLFADTAGSEMECETWLMADAAGEICGYMRLPASHFGEELTVNEVSRLSAPAALAALNHLRTLAEQRKKPGLRLNTPANCDLIRVARPFAAAEHSTYAWQIQVPDMAALLRAIGPVLERRVAASPLAGLTCEANICLYRETIALRFDAGRLIEVTGVGFTERGAINFPPLQLIPLVLGWRTLDELRRCYPDVHVSSAWRLLIDTLFPKRESFLYTVY